ncbi:16770_t:CDS:2, partial [Gigaspora margarita]
MKSNVVLRTDTQKHPDGHYCLVSVKYARQFASMFADMSVIIFQNDKAKDLQSLILNPQYNDILKFDEQIKPIWVLLVDRQLKYNPVEREIATLSGKLAGITLSIDYFGKHLDSQGKSRDLIFEKHVHAQYIDTFMNPFDDLQFE